MLFFIWKGDSSDLPLGKSRCTSCGWGNLGEHRTHVHTQILLGAIFEPGICHRKKNINNFFRWKSMIQCKLYYNEYNHRMHFLQLRKGFIKMHFEGG